MIQNIDFFCLPRLFSYTTIRQLHFVLFLLQSGNFSEDMIPTVGFNMRKVTKGNVTIKVWGRIYAVRLAGYVTHCVIFFRYWWSAKIQIHVGAVLSRRERYRVSGLK